MSTLTPRLGLKRHTTADVFRIQDYADNWAVLEAFPGVFPCLSTSRPSTWTAAHAGMFIIETDTGLLWRWSGTAFVRQVGSGHLAEATRTTDISTSSTVLTSVLSQAVTVPAGGRRVLVKVAGPGVYSTAGQTRLAIFRGETQLQQWQVAASIGAGATQQPVQVLGEITDQPTAGVHTYSLRAAAVVGFGGTSTLQGGTNMPLSLAVVEV